MIERPTPQMAHVPKPNTVAGFVDTTVVYRQPTG
jgi:hypothetical protein